jgi:hypothetical protein
MHRGTRQEAASGRAPDHSEPHPTEPESMRRMSFSLTKRQLLDGTKTVTRRKGWEWARPGDQVVAVSKAMGLKPGEHAEVYGTVEFLDVRTEPLEAITDEDVAREGFPGRDRAWFVEHFCQAMRCEPSTIVRRIEFRFEPTRRAQAELFA